MSMAPRPAATGLERAAVAGTSAQRYDVAGQRVGLDLYIVETTRTRVVLERVYYAVRAESHDDAGRRWEHLEGQPVDIETIRDGSPTERIAAVRHALEHTPQREDTP
jgi:hypothetical protein